MRKLFSLIAAVLFAGSMMAQVTITPGDFTETTSADFSTVKEGVTVAVTASTVTADQIRIFKGQTITISAESNITSIVFTCTANGTAKYGPGSFAAQAGYTFEAEGKTGTWEGSATSVTFTAETNQVRATQIVVTLAGGEVPPTPQPATETVVYNWSTVEAEQVGTTILGSAVEESSVKIHMNEESIPALKLGSSYVYAEGKWAAMKPADGFKAGDTIKFAGAFSNDATDGSKYAQIDFYAADQATRLFRSDSVVNGKKTNDDPVVEYFVLEADQDSIFVGRYGNTGLFVTMLKAVRPAGEVVPPTPEDTWTVAGEPTTAFGSSWTPSDASNDMVKQEDGSYKWERTGLELGAGTVKFKVVKNHAWDEAYPAQNYELAIAEAGIYTITITFEPANENNVSAVATKTGEAVVVPTVVMHGQFASNDWADTEAFAKSEDKKTATLKLTLEAKTIEFGMKFDGSWKANGANITREAASTSLAEGSGNMHLVADVAGEYTFTYTYETQVLAVTYPAEAPVVTPITCAAVYALEKNAEVTLNDVVVTYVNGKNVWVKDATGAMLLYLAANATWSEGDVLAGVAGVVDIYNGLYEVKPSADQAAAVVATPGEAPEPELLTVITDADVNKYIIIEGVTAEGEFVEGTASNITITMGDATYTLRNNFKNAYTFEAGSTYTVLALVSYFKTGIQLYFIDAEDEGGQSDLNYDYEPTTVSTFDVTIASVSVKDHVADYGVITFELEDADGAYFAYLELISSTSEPATGTYPINFTEQDGTFYASPGGDDEYDYGCYFGVMDGEYYNPYYMVSGSVEIAEDGMTVNATSYNGSTIKLTYKAPEEAIDNTEVKASAVKFLQNDQLIIEKNGVRYNVNGQQIR